MLHSLEQHTYPGAKLSASGKTLRVSLWSLAGRYYGGYTSRFATRLKGIVTLDNAMAESFIATLKTELFVYRCRFLDQEVARSAIFEYLEGFYNRRRRLHSALGYKKSPAS